MSKPNLSRSAIREIAFQALFPLNFNADLSKQDALTAVFELDHPEWLNDEQTAFVPVYLDTLVDGVTTKKDELDAIIAKHLNKNWSLARIAKTDLVILRLALFEMIYVSEEDVPKKVAVNEAIELAKKYADDSSRKFINGVLSNVLAEL
ncbi:transcription antitermination factor NusB [Enterococcus nangangensis]